MKSILPLVAFLTLNQMVFTGGGDEEAIARGIFDTYQKDNLRYSQMAPVTMWTSPSRRTPDMPTGSLIPG